MKRSTNRILTTHVGSLIRPQPLQEFLRAKQGGKPYDEKAYQQCLTVSVTEVVREQADAGIDVVSDGEFGKSISWAQYALERLSGFERRPIKQETANPFKRGADRTKFAEFYAELDAKEAVSTTTEAICVGPIKYTGQAELQRDIDNLKAALKSVKVEEAFLPVAAPASVIPDRKNEYYKGDEDLQAVIAEAMRTEYKMIVDSGFLLQLDDARSAVTFDRMVPPASFADYRQWLSTQVDILNHAIDRGIKYFDTAWVYSAGQSEQRIGQVAKHRRGEMWIATKVQARDREGARKQLEESLLTSFRAMDAATASRPRS